MQSTDFQSITAIIIIVVITHRQKKWNSKCCKFANAYLINTQMVNVVANIPILANSSGTYAQGLHQSITCKQYSKSYLMHHKNEKENALKMICCSITSAFNLSQPFFRSFGAQPGEHDMHVSFLTNASSRHFTHDQQHES